MPYIEEGLSDQLTAYCLLGLLLQTAVLLAYVWDTNNLLSV